VGFILGVNAVAEGHARGVENHRHMVALIALHQFPDHIHKAIHRAHRRSLRVGERWHGVVGAEDKSRTVDQVEMLGHDSSHTRA